MLKLSINQLKYVKSLHQRKFRQKYHNFIVEGVKMVQEVLLSGVLEVEGIYALPDWAIENKALLLGYEEKLTHISVADLSKISLLATPNSVLLVAKQPSIPSEYEGFGQTWSLYLENLQDPGNLGSILRIADWFGIRWVFCSPDSVEAFNPKVVQASMGAFLRVNCVEMKFDEIKNRFPELPVYAAVLGGKSIFQTDFGDNGLLVIGNESKGVSAALATQADYQVSIPKGQGGGAESLNASVAAGILCAVIKIGK